MTALYGHQSSPPPSKRTGLGGRLVDEACRFYKSPDAAVGSRRQESDNRLEQTSEQLVTTPAQNLAADRAT